jgi:hypothetical protein
MWNSRGIYLEELRKLIKTSGRSVFRLRFELCASTIQLTGITTKIVKLYTCHLPHYLLNINA